MTRRTWFLILGGWMTVAAIFACLGPLPSTPGPTSSPSPSLMRAAFPSCYGIGIAGASASPWSLTDVARSAPLIVVGQLTGYGAPRWDTPDRSRPSDPFEAAIIVRPALIEIERLIRGDAAGVGRALVRGGQIGCDTVTTDDTNFPIATRFLLLLARIDDSDETWRGDYSILYAWPIDSADNVTTPVNGRVPLAKIIDTVAKVTLAP